jgi:hypothetical protein
MTLAGDAKAGEFMYRTSTGQVALFAGFSAIISGFRRVWKRQSK